MTILEFLSLSRKKQKKYLRKRYNKILTLDQEKFIRFKKDYKIIRKALGFTTYYGKNLVKGKRGPGPDFISIDINSLDHSININFFDSSWKSDGEGKRFVTYYTVLTVIYNPNERNTLTVEGRLEKGDEIVAFKDTREYIKARGWI